MSTCEYVGDFPKHVRRYSRAPRHGEQGHHQEETGGNYLVVSG